MVVETIFAVLALSAVAALAARAVAQRRHATRQPPIGANGIDDAGFVEIGGIPQWVQIRGANRANPVLLVLHGGPGAALSAVSYALFARAETEFTVVHWDQRGAGRTFGKNGRRSSGEMSIARMTRDGIQVAEHLCARLGKRNIVLCALSWGSVLALGMLKARPDLFAAYVGTGQIVDMPLGERFAYETLLVRARHRRLRPAIAALEWIGPPPFGGGKARRIWQQWLLDFAPASERRAMREMPLLLLTAPRAGLRDVYDTLAGVIFSYGHLFDALMAFETEPLGMNFGMPMFFFQGSDDLQTPTRLVADYVTRIKAPRKELVLLEGGGHMVIRTMGERFIEELTKRVRPVAIRCYECGTGLAPFLP